MVTLEIACGDGHVLLSFDDGASVVEIVMSPDEARELSNSLGEVILRVSRTGVMAT